MVKLKCLGVWIDDCLTWRDHIADVEGSVLMLSLTTDTTVEECSAS